MDESNEKKYKNVLLLRGEVKLIFVTGNRHKFQEAQAILKEWELEQREIEDLPEIQGTGAEVARQKAITALQHVQAPLFVDDTSLEFTAWNGLPGPYIKDFRKKLGCEGIWRLLEHEKDKSAQAVASIAFIEPGKEPVILEGRVEGTIVPPRKESSFGWDQRRHSQRCRKRRRT